MESKIFDIEVYPNAFCVTIRDYFTKEQVVYRIDDEHNDFDKIKEFYSTYRGVLFSFNGIHYDNVVIAFMIVDNIDTPLSIWKFSNKLIGSDAPIPNKYKYWSKWIDIDFYLYWAKLLRLSKKISLKALGIQLGYKTLKELPYLNVYLNADQIDEVIEYNSFDIDIVELLVNEFREDINLRLWIWKTYDLKCMSWDAIKIASELLLKKYCERVHKEPNDVRKWHFSISDFKIGDYIPSFVFKTDILKQVYYEIYESGRSFHKQFVYNSNGNYIKISLGIGGIHSLLENKRYSSTNETIIITSDIASLYPTNIINGKTIRFPEVLEIYKEIKAERLVAKRNKDKVRDKLLKLILNGTSGLLDNEYSWLYCPELATALRVTGQLQLLRTIEEVTLAGFQVLSINTDGLEVIVPRDKTQIYYDVMSEIEQEFNIQWEHEEYKQIVFLNINSYIAETSTGYIKKKGDFVTKPELGNSVNELVIAKALEAYWIHGISVTEFITNHKELKDFLISRKVDKRFDVYWNGVKQQQLNRYYVSRKGAFLYYKNEKGKLNNLLKGFAVVLMNNLTSEFPNDINYNYYINKTLNLINPFLQKEIIEDSHQSLLF